jgi:hypothetical protein
VTCSQQTQRGTASVLVALVMLVVLVVRTAVWALFGPVRIHARGTCGGVLLAGCTGLAHRSLSGLLLEAGTEAEAETARQRLDAAFEVLRRAGFVVIPRQWWSTSAL